MFETLLQTQYGLRLRAERRASSGAGSETWLLRCDGGDHVLKLPDKSAVNHPELCAFLRENGIPACDFLKNCDGSFLSADADGRVFTVQRRFSGYTPAWNCAPEELLLESSELLGKIHQVLRAYPALPEGIGAAYDWNALFDSFPGDVPANVYRAAVLSGSVVLWLHADRCESAHGKEKTGHSDNNGRFMKPVNHTEKRR